MKVQVTTCLALLVAASGAFAAERPATVDLDQAIALALENNYTIRQARAQYEEATGVVMSAKAGQLPTVSIDAGYTQVDEGLLKTPAGTTAGEPESWSTGVTATQALYTGGAVSSSIKSSKAAQDAAMAAFEAAVQQALFDVRTRYYAVLLAREQVGVQEQSVKLLEEELANARSRVKAGSGSPFEQLRAEVALANGQPPLIRARNDYRLAAVELLRVVGLPAGDWTVESLVGELTFENREYTLESLLGSALANRPEIRQLEHQVAAAESGVDTAASGSKPTVALFGGYQVKKSAYTSDIGTTVDGWNVGVQGSWAIFDGRETRGRVRQAKSRLEQARLYLDEAKIAIEAEVRQAYSSYLEAAELVRASQKVVEQAEESLRLARSRYAAGAGTQLDVLQTQVALTEARLNEAQALYEANLATAGLLRVAALAGLPAGVQRPGEAPPAAETP
ncbi:MAG: TolC family protein [Opitutaceae bacterium]|nr:TolC family protein [Opitutaceae bacterium]